MQARLRTAFGSAATVEGLLTRLALVVHAVRLVDHVAYREALGSTVLDYQHLVDVKEGDDLRLVRHYDWTNLERVEIEVILVLKVGISRVWI